MKAKLFQFIGVKDYRVFVTWATGVDEAYLNIGELMTGHRQRDAGNVDLELFGKVTATKGTVEIEVEE